VAIPMLAHRVFGELLSGTNYNSDDAIHCPFPEWLRAFFRALTPKTPLGSTHTRIVVKYLFPFNQARTIQATLRRPSSQGFYKSVRCGVLHEARTKGTWLIHAKSESSLIVDRNGPDGPILYRDDFQEGISTFNKKLLRRCPQNIPLQQAFIRKFEHLCI